MIPPIGPPFKQHPPSHKRLQTPSESQAHQIPHSRATHGLPPSHSAATTSRAAITAYVHPMHSAEGIRRRSKTASSQLSAPQDGNKPLTTSPSPVMTLLKNVMTNNQQKDKLNEIKDVLQKDFKEWSQDYPTDASGKLFITRSRHHLDRLESLFKSDENRLAQKLAFFGSQEPSPSKIGEAIYMLRDQIESYMCFVVSETEKALYAQISENISKTMNSESSNKKEELAHIVVLLKEQTFLTESTVEILRRQIARAEATL